MMSSLMSTQVVKCFGRRTLVIWGHLGMAVTHALVGYFSANGVDLGVVIGILVFLIVY